MEAIVFTIGQIIAYIGGGAFVVLALSTFLGKFWAKRILNDEVEKLRSSFKRIESEYSIKFNAFHTQRAKVVADIYALLVEVENNTIFLATPLIEENNAYRSDIYSKTANSIFKLSSEFNKNRIYLSEKLCMQLSKFINASQRPMAFYKLVKCANLQDPNGENMELQQNLQRKFIEVWDEVETKVPELRKAIETEFRNIITVPEKFT